MKIAFLNIYQNKVNRGAETFVSELSKRLAKDHDTYILTSLKPLFRKRYDIVIPTNGRLQALLVRIITWLTHSKMIISGQSGAGLDDRINLYSFPDAFIGLTEYQSNWAKKVNPEVLVETIPNGVDLSVFTPSREHKLTDTILSVGAFTKDKRHELTINAVEKLTDIKLIIAGSGGSQKDYIEKLGRKKLGSRFEIASVGHGQMPDIYKNANVLAFPSVKWESFGIVLVEAMASGLPVVATKDPIRREIVGVAGILIDPTNTEEYSKALQKALDTKWGDKPRKQAEKFSWDGIAQKYEELIKTLVKKN